MDHLLAEKPQAARPALPFMPKVVPLPEPPPAVLEAALAVAARHPAPAPHRSGLRRAAKPLAWGVSALFHAAAIGVLLIPAAPPETPVPAVEVETMPAPEPAPAPDPAPVTEAAPPAAPPDSVAAAPPEPAAATPPPETAAPPPPDAAQPPPPEAAPPPPPEAVTPPPPDTAPPPPPDAARPPPPDEVAMVEPDPVPPPPPEAPPPPEPPPVEATEEPPPLPPPPAPPPPPVPVVQPPRPRAPAPRPVRPQVAEQAPVQPYTPPVAAPPAAVPSPAPAPAAPAAPARAAGGLPSNYVGQIQAALRRVQRYPAGARARRAEGVVNVGFVLRRDGTVISARVVRSSGESDLDEEAEAMLRRVSLPPMPDDMAGNTVDMVVPIRFSLSIR
ncbi:energy transducer TonB [Pararoseomonas sp. SCSIO 73927]|uniref:energy transducer TonB n=1 Tax=Pararoseomonas sp. SCSIO 73927 TaxID=3114537 RepID=UPI0030D61300